MCGSPLRDARRVCPNGRLCCPKRKVAKQDRGLNRFITKIWQLTNDINHIFFISVHQTNEITVVI